MAKLLGDYAQMQIADSSFEGVEPSPDDTVPAAVEAGKLLPKMGYEPLKKRFVAWMVEEEYLSKVPGSDIKPLVKSRPRESPNGCPIVRISCIRFFTRRFTRGEAASSTHLQIQVYSERPRTLPITERAKVDGFYAARETTAPPLQWPSIAPPFSE